MKIRLIFLFAFVIISAFLKAQTGGPGQPEFMQFKQAGTSGLVNPSTGSFSYQIPLFTIGGYPMNLTYQAGIQMEDVSTMVGLGWNLNAGCIVRNLRGLPDDFNKDQIVKEFSLADNETFGGNLGVDVEIAGLPIGLSVGAGMGIFWNSYKGWGLEPSLRGSLSTSFNANSYVGGSASLGMGVSVNSQSGVEKYISPNIGLKLGTGNDKLSISLGKTWSVNSTVGLSTSLNTSLSYVRYSQLKEGFTKGVNDGHTADQQTTDQSSLSLLGMSSRSYLNNSYNPDIEYPFVNTSESFSGTLGLDMYFVDPNLRITGYHSKQTLSTKIQQFSAVGSMYECEKGNMDANSLMDFSREKKLPFILGESKILPIPYITPDVFNLNAQGLSMTFSVSKNDLGIVGDARAMINSSGYQIGLEANLGNLFKAGGNFGTNDSYQLSERWLPTNLPDLDFLSTQLALPQTLHDITTLGLYQRFYFKNHGEINKFDNSLFFFLGEYEPIKLGVLNEKSADNILSNLVNINGIGRMNNIQPVRQSTISYLTALESSTMGFDKQIKYYKFYNANNDNSIKTIDRNFGYRFGHHLSEISVTQPDGMKYVFGIPVYNITQKEVTFNVVTLDNEIPSGDLVEKDNLVKYSSIGDHKDNSTSNLKGIDNFYESMTTPAYATQFLITAVLSPDYRDLTNDGISDDDIGNYVKFNYYKEDFINPDNSVEYNYRWRTPVGENKATYNKGLRSDIDDDKGTYVYGEKELWYVHSIESKTEIAEYYYSKREDGFGVLSENGGVDPKLYLRKLDSIRVFSKYDRIKNNTNEIPIKAIHFSFDPGYPLCKNTKNGRIITTTPLKTSGKLTLNKVAITYEKSQKGKLTPYEFEYGKLTDEIIINPDDERIINPDYNIRDVNRWGYYQKNSDDAYSDCSDSKSLSNIDFPYSSQDRSEMDKNAYAWNLTDLTIPGGGKIRVDYSANDYSYIQDKTPGRMFMVEGLDSPSGNSLYDNNPYSSFKMIYFKLLDGHNNITKEELKEKYLKDIVDNNGFLYYKFYVKIKTEDGKDMYEYVSGYAKVREINGYGVDGIGNGWVALEEVFIDDEHTDYPNPDNPLKPQGDPKCNPILKTALQFTRINRNKLIYSNSNAQETAPTGLSGFAFSLPTIVTELKSQIDASIMGINQYCINGDPKICESIDINKSFIRLYDPIKKKISGGCRVDSISIFDSWDKMTDDITTDKRALKKYTTYYDYTTEETDPISNIKVKISSGVADYEPMVGGDEISLKRPIFYSDKKKYAPDNDYYVEEPVNESLFPSPQIVYGKVTQITNNDNPNVGKTGKIVNEFYTAKDYPVKVNMTCIDFKRDQTEFNAFQYPFVAIDQQHDYVTVSQGYSIELNNMSGVPKSTWVYNENGDRISGEVSEYFSDNNNLTTVDRFGFLNNNAKLGLSVEYTIDGRRSYDKSIANVYSVNLNTSLITVFPLLVLMPLYSEMTEEKQFQSIVINKIIHRNGILKSKTVFEQSASITTNNLAFDEVTGEAILTSTKNEFNNLLYSFKYPAYWMYEGMGPSYVNTKLKLNTTDSRYPELKNLLKIGDELRSDDADLTKRRLWVKSISPLPTFVNASKVVTPLSIGTNYQVYNSSAKNLLSESSGQIVIWTDNPEEDNPLPSPTSNYGSPQIYFAPSHILNSTSVEYYDTSVVYCEPCRKGIYPYNDFLLGKKGNWKPKQTWFYLANRTSGNNIRTDGMFENYSEFWSKPHTNTNPYPKWIPNYTGWEWKEKVNHTDVDGQTIETENRIGAKVANLLGYKNTLVLAQVNNSSYNEAYYDGFEDYHFSYCSDSSYALTKIELKRVHSSSTVNLSSTESHTGKYSLEVTDQIKFNALPPQTAPRPCDEPCIGCIGGLYPELNEPPESIKEFLFSCWVKGGAQVEIKTTASTLPVTLSSEGPVIEGWQRIMGTFKKRGDSHDISVTLRSINGITFYDDIRIIPADGNMVSYVYDEVNLRHRFTLDENNYFTEYQYNNQGELVRIKQETEKGIVTKKEVNQSLTKNLIH